MSLLENIKEVKNEISEVYRSPLNLYKKSLDKIYNGVAELGGIIEHKLDSKSKEYKTANDMLRKISDLEVALGKMLKKVK